MGKEREAQRNECLLRYLSFQFIILSVTQQDEYFYRWWIDIYGFIRETSSCYYSLMGDMILWGLKDKYCILMPLLIDNKKLG